MQTTIGQILVNEALPEEYRDYGRVLDKGGTDDLLKHIARENPKLYREISHKLLQLGRHAAFDEGTTLRLRDIHSNVDKADLLAHVKQQEARINASSLSKEEKQEAREAVYFEVNEALKGMTMDAASSAGNPFALQVKSRARGNPDQLTALLTTPGIYQDGKDRVIPLFIQRSYAEGLMPHEYWAATYGARKGVISCLTYDTQIIMSDWSIRPIGELKVGDRIMGVGFDKRIKPVTVSRVFHNGTQPVYEYIFRKNATTEFMSVKCTENHKFLSRVWKAGPRGTPRLLSEERLHPIKEATFQKRHWNNNYIAQLPAGFDDNGLVREDRALLLGVMLGDGCTSPSCHGSMTLSCADPKLADDLNMYLKRFNLELRKALGNNYNWTLVTIDPALKSWHYTKDGKKMDNETRAWLWDLIGNEYAHTKSVPDCVSMWDNESCMNLVAGYLAADGSVYKAGRGGVNFSSCNRELAEGVAYILETRFGIWCGPVNHTRHKNRRDMYAVSITHPESLLRFKDIFTLPGRKQRLLDELDVDFVEGENARLGCRAQFRRFVGHLPVIDIEVDDPAHMFVLANGLISSNSKFSTRQAGALGKLLGSAVMSTVVVEDDCGTERGIPVDVDDMDNVGTVLARERGGFGAGTIVDKNVLSGLKKGKLDSLTVRSPVTCESPNGVCKKCTGIREEGDFPPLGYHLGLNASTALAEQISQGALNVKHSGKKSQGKTVYSGFDVIRNLATVPQHYPHSATVAEEDGKVTDIKEAPQGGYKVFVNDVPHHVPASMPVIVKVGDKLEAGDPLSDGVLNPADVVRHKGVGEGRRYFAERFIQAFRDSNMRGTRRNAEVLARSVVNNVQANDTEAAGSMLPGEITSYSAWAKGYKPRKDSVRASAKASVGSYLDEPALHYTIGTRVTKRVADTLNKHGIDDVLVNRVKTGVDPVMVSVVKAPEFGEDWMARLGSTYLKTRLAKDVHMGAESNLHSSHPLPGVAKGVEFGKQVGKYYTY